MTVPTWPGRPLREEEAIKTITVFRQTLGQRLWCLRTCPLRFDQCDVKEDVTLLQGSESDVWLLVPPQRPTADGVLRDGHLSLSGLQMRAHAMFSAQGLPLGSDTLEYAWLIDMQAGALTGRVTVPQVGHFTSL